MASELDEILESLKYLTYWNTGKRWDFFLDAGEKLFVPKIDEEFLEEMKGIAEGAQSAGVDITWQEVLTWNGYFELTGYWWPNEKAGKYAKGDQTDKDRCSAFIATGSATREGRIVMAHNSWDAFEQGQFFNLILDIQPAGAVDGKVMDSDMAKDLSFWARWGSSSGMAFDAKKFLAEHTQYSHLDGYLKDRPTQPWTLFKADEGK